MITFIPLNSTRMRDDVDFHDASPHLEFDTLEQLKQWLRQHGVVTSDNHHPLELIDAHHYKFGDCKIVHQGNVVGWITTPLSNTEI